MPAASDFLLHPQTAKDAKRRIPGLLPTARGSLGMGWPWAPHTMNRPKMDDILLSRILVSGLGFRV